MKSKQSLLPVVDKGKNNHTLELINRCNLALLHASNETKLLNDFCNILAEHCHYNLVWIAYACHDQEKTVKLAAQAGQDDGYIEKLKITWDDSLNGRGPVGVAIRTGKACYVSDIKSDLKFKPWRTSALERGFKSCIGIPLIINGEVIGALVIYADKANAFTSEEQKLVENIAENLAFGIDTLRTREGKIKAENLLALENAIFKIITSKPALDELLNAIIIILEKYLPESKCSILLLTDDKKHLQLGAAPNLPKKYNDLINGIEIGESEGSCGTAAFLKKQIIVDDISTSPLWKKYRDIANYFNFKACCSIPILSSTGEVLGTFANYYENVRAPNDEELELINRMANILGNVIEGRTVKKAFAESEERLRCYYDAGLVGMAIISLDKSWIDFNDTLCDITGYDREELENLSWTDITHPDDIEKDISLFNKILAGKIDNCSLHTRYLHKDGSIINISISVESVKNHEGSINYFVAIIQDISDRHEKDELSKQLTYQATHDALTGLANRSEFERRLNQLISSDTPDKNHALCYLDLDQFKVINDTCGHVAGDELLRQLSNRIVKRVRKQDMLARLGGDEFGVLMENCSIEQAERVAHDLCNLIYEHEFVWEDKPYQLGVSIGLVPINGKNITAVEALSAADAACYTAKDAGRNRIHIYDVEDEQVQKRHGEMQWISRIKKALQQDQLCLYYQPIIALKEEPKILGGLFEVLVRMQGDDGAIISPALFLPAAERYNISTKIDRWVVDRTLKWLASQNHQDSQLTKVNINLSGHSLSDLEFMGFLLDKIAATNVAPDVICFEITETATIANLSIASHFINTLRGTGCQFALDDFGSGLSSLNYLKNLPVDYLKIDGAFVRDIVEDPIDHAMVESINQIAQVMGKKTIAEFVENREILEKLKAIGVDYVQGYHIGKPVLMCKGIVN